MILTRRAILAASAGTLAMPYVARAQQASITVAAGSYIDAASNGGEAGLTPLISIDTSAPRVSPAWPRSTKWVALASSAISLVCSSA